jgi:hypothetical protein
MEIPQEIVGDPKISVWIEFDESRKEKNRERRTEHTRYG